LKRHSLPGRCQQRWRGYFAGVLGVTGFAFATGVCFSTWLAAAHSASLAGSFLQVTRTLQNYFKP
jgi:cytochrome b subunit of formate dehydrogenase